MDALLAKIQQQPDRVKRRVAFFASLAISLVIFAVWFTSLHGSLAVDSGAAGKVSSEASVGELISPISTVSETVSDGFKTIKMQFEELSKLFK